MSQKTNTQIIRINNQSFPISELTEFGFKTDSKFPAQATGGTFVSESVEIDVQFTARHQSEQHTYYVFSDIAPEDRKKIKGCVKESASVARARVEKKIEAAKAAPVVPQAAVGLGRVAEQSLPQRPVGKHASTDSTPSEGAETIRIASCTSDSTDQQATRAESNAAPTSVIPPSRSSRPAQSHLSVSNTSFKEPSMLKKSLFILPFVLGGMFLLVKFWWTGNENHVAVSPAEQGEITQVLVEHGDQIKEGDLLFQVSQKPCATHVAELNEQLELLQAELVAAEKSLAVHQKKMDLITAKRKMELDAVQAEVDVAAKAKEETQKTVDRVKPYRESGAVSQVEFERIEVAFLQANAKWIEKNNLLKNLQFDHEAAEAKILVESNGINDKLAQLEIQHELVRAKHDHLEKQIQGKQAGTTLNVYAPCDGQISRVKKGIGDFVKTDEQMLYLKQSN